LFVPISPLITGPDDDGLFVVNFWCNSDVNDGADDDDDNDSDDDVKLICDDDGIDEGFIVDVALKFE
jgi:hypothetical protein